MLFDETYFEDSNINQKLLIWSQDKIIPKFDQKNGRVWFRAKCTKTTRKLRMLFYETYFEKSNTNRKTPNLDQRYDNNEI